MEVKNLFSPAVKEEIINRINKLTPTSKTLWGTMNVEQMMAHLQRPIALAFGKHKLKGSFILKLIGPLFKSVLYNEKPYKHGLPTDKTYIVSDAKNFEQEKNKLVEMIYDFKEENISDNKHEIFGKLTKEQWSKATWKHINHHLRQFGV